MRSDVAFIVPVYNEVAVVEEVLAEILRSYRHVVCVNDCSTDGSEAAIGRTEAYLINHPVNMGQGAALQTGIEFARELPGVRYFVTFDSDGQHRLEDVERMLGILERENKDIVLGSRFLGNAVGISHAKRLVLKLATGFTNLTSGLRLTDTHNGLRVFNRRVAQAMQITLPDMAHASEILQIIGSQGFSYCEAPVTVTYTDYSKTKGQSLINSVNVATDTLLRRVSH